MKAPRWLIPLARRLGFVPARRNAAFAAASLGRLTNSWTTDPGAVNRWVRWELNTLRARSRDLVRSDAYASKWAHMVVGNVAGPRPFAMRARVRKARGAIDLEANKRLEQAWSEFGRASVCDAAGRQSLASLHRSNLRSWASDGEVLLRLYPGEGPHGLRIQPLDPVRLDVERNETLSNGGAIKLGVELDRYGRAVAYHLLRQHPGEYGLWGSGATRETERIPAAQIIHAFVPEWPEQVRGIPPMSAAMLRLWHLGGFEEAAVINARVGASKVAAITLPEDDASPLAAATDTSGNFLSDTEPGQYWQIPTGSTLQPWSPAFPDAAVEPFVRGCLRGVGAALGVAYHSLANDPSNVNYSTARVALLEERDMWEALQAWYVEQVVVPIFEAWLLYAPLVGAIPSGWTAAPRIRNVRWQGKTWQWIDPQKEVAAKQAAIDARLTSRTRVCDESGEDFEDVLEEIRAEEELAESLGVSLTAAAQPAAPKAQAQPDAPTPEPEPDESPDPDSPD